MRHFLTVGFASVLLCFTARAAVTFYDVESSLTTTSFSSGGQTWTLTGPMSIHSGADLGAPLSGNATPSTPGYIDSVFGATRANGDNVGGFKAPTGFVFRAASFDVWPSSDGGNNVYGGTNNTLGTVGLHYTVIGKRNGSQVVTANVDDTARTPAQTSSAPGGFWHHLDLSSTAFATTDIDTVEFVLAAQSGANMNYIAVDNFGYSNFGAPNTAPAFVGATTTLAVNQNASATDIKGLLHVSDSDSSQTETWSQSSAPSHGTLSFSTATAASGSTDITPGGTITYTPTAGYFGSDSFTVQVSDATATATRTISVTVSDVTKPTVASVVRQSPGGQNLAANASSVTFRVTYSEALSATPAAGRYAIENVNGGTVTGNIGTPTFVSAGVYDVVVTITGGSGEFRLKVVD